MALIHVVIPVYNTLSYVRESVESVLRQPCSDQIDICLVDDGSTDGSADICDMMAENNENIYVIHQENAGVSAARNAGIDFFLERSSGDDDHSYIAFLDADDVWESIFDRKLIKKLNNEKHIDVSLFGDTCSDESCMKVSNPNLYVESIAEGGNGVIWKTKGHFGANLYRTRLIKVYNIRFINGLKYSEDKIFLLQCMFLAEKVKFFSELLYVCRQNGNPAKNYILKIEPVEYYVPIINGWIESDLFVNKFFDRTNKRTNAGFVLASIYFGDMAREHYKQRGSVEKLKKIEEHPYYYLFQEMDEKSVSKKQYAEHNLLMKHPILYKVKYNIVGTVENVLRKMAKTKPIRKYRMKKKYPLTINDIHKLCSKKTYMEIEA